MAHASMSQPHEKVKLSGDHACVPRQPGSTAVLILQLCGFGRLCVVALLFPPGVWLACFPRLTLVAVTPAADGGRAGVLSSCHRSPALLSILSLDFTVHKALFHQQNLLSAASGPIQSHQTRQ